MTGLEGTFFESKRGVVQLWAMIVLTALVESADIDGSLLQATKRTSC